MKWIEETLASVVERLCRCDFGVELGARTARDGVDGSGLRVDYSYDAASVPVALEVTSVQVDTFRAAIAEAGKVEARLCAVAQAEDLSSVSVVVDSDSDFRAVEAFLVEVVRRGEPVTHDYSSADLDRWDRLGTMKVELAIRDRMSALGISSIERIADSRGVVAVSTHEPITESNVGFGDLSQVIAANLSKLEEAVGYEKHLAIGIGRVANLGVPPPVPALPSALAMLWVVPLYTPIGGQLGVLSLRSGAPDWTQHAPVDLRS